MKNNFHIFPFVFFLLLGLVACEDKGDGDGNNNNPCNTAWATSTSEELQAYSSAAMAFGSNPTQENCEAFKDASQDYLDALKGYENCSGLTAQDRSNLESEISQAEASLAELDCTELN